MLINFCPKHFQKYLKLAKITLTHILGSVEDEKYFSYERYFSSVSFLKSKLWNQLNLHLQLLVVMYAQKNFTPKNFHMQLHLKARLV
jgi:hypothetical protein